MKDFSYVSGSIEIYIKTMIKCVVIVRRFSQLCDCDMYVCIESLEKMKVIFGRALNVFHATRAICDREKVQSTIRHVCMH